MDFNKFKDICQQSLLSDSEALAYVSERRLSIDSINTFDIGYCPVSLRPYLRDTDLEWLLHRVVFPITDAYGNIVAFAGRAIDGRKPKYINTAYSKSDHFYNLDKAKQAIYNSNYVVLVEGYMDAIALYMSGVHNVVALCGVAFKARRLAMLARYTDRALVLLDSDDAGEKAGSKVTQMFLDSGFQVKSMSLYPYKDADEAINSVEAENFVYNVINCFNSLVDTDIDWLRYQLEELSNE